MNDQSGCCGCLFSLSFVVAYLWSCIWIYRDVAVRKNQNEAVLWAALAVIFPVCIPLVYFIMRETSSRPSNLSFGQGSQTFVNLKNSLLTPEVRKKVENLASSVRQALTPSVEPVEPSVKPLSYQKKDTKRLDTIFEAVSQGNQESVEEFLNKGVDVNLQDEKGATPLHYAALSGDRRIAELLIARGASPGDEDYDGRTPLHWAASAGINELVNRLIYSYSDVNAKDYAGRTPLHDAAEKGHSETIRLLLSNGANYEQEDYDGISPLKAAEKSGKQDAANVLRSYAEARRFKFDSF